MTSAQLDKIIEAAGAMAQEALGEIHDGILQAAQAKLEEASEADNGSDNPPKIKLSIPLKLVIRLDTAEPRALIAASTARQWSSEVGETVAPKTGAERQREYRLRKQASGE